MSRIISSEECLLMYQEVRKRGMNYTAVLAEWYTNNLSVLDHVISVERRIDDEERRAKLEKKLATIEKISKSVDDVNVEIYNICQDLVSGTAKTSIGTYIYFDTDYELCHDLEPPKIKIPIKPYISDLVVHSVIDILYPDFDHRNYERFGLKAGINKGLIVSESWTNLIDVPSIESSMIVNEAYDPGFNDKLSPGDTGVYYVDYVLEVQHLEGTKMVICVGIDNEPVDPESIRVKCRDEKYDLRYLAPGDSCYIKGSMDISSLSSDYRHVRASPRKHVYFNLMMCCNWQMSVAYRLDIRRHVRFKKLIMVD